MHKVRRARRKALAPLVRGVSCLVPFVLRSARRGREGRVVWLSGDLYSLVHEHPQIGPVAPLIGKWRGGRRKSVYIAWDIRQDLKMAKRVVAATAELISMAAARRN